MTPPRPLAAVLLAAVVAVGLVGCGSSEDSSDVEETAPETSETEEPTDVVDEPAEEPATDDGPCGLVTEDEIVAAYGPVDGGSPGQHSRDNTSNDISWKSNLCVWTTEDEVEVKVGVASEDAFDGGTLQCPEPLGILGDVEPVEVEGAEQAWWTHKEFMGGLQTELRACTDASLLQIEVDLPDLETPGDEAREHSTEWAASALDRLG